MKKFVRTIVPVTFDDMNAASEDDNLIFVQNQVDAGFLCSIGFEGDTQKTILISVKYPNWYAEVGSDCFEEINAMELLAEVHAGNIPDKVLEELS